MKNLISKFVTLSLSSFVMSLSAQLPSYLPTNGLVAWYPFNGNANDESGNGNDGVVNGASLSIDRFGGNGLSYHFDGINDYIIVPFNSNFNVRSVSISGWLNAYELGGVRGLVSRWNQANSPCSNYSASIDNLASNIVGACSEYTNTVLYTPNSIVTNEWYHFVYNHDENDGGSLYLNGLLLASNSITGNICESNNDLYFGAQMNQSSIWRYFSGTIDDIAIYNRALTQAEVTALYTATATNTGGGSTSTTTAPPGIPYQAEVRNESGEVLANANVNVRFTLHELTANGTVSYRETHAITTNDLGLFAATIGAGSATQGTFAGINWSQTTKFLQVEVDAGNDYITMGNQQLMSVPYALYAANGPAGPAGPQGPQGPVGAQGETGVGISNATLTNGYLNLQLSNGESISLGQVGLPQNTPVTATTQTNATANYSNLSDVELPSFLNYYGNCALGNKIVANNELLPIYGSYCNLRIPLGVNAKINAAKTTFIYVSDTLFLDGVIDGAGSNASMNSDNMGNNHVGATGSGFFHQQCCSAPFPGSSTSSFSFSSTNQPTTYFYSAGGTITINGPAFNGGSMWGGSGNNMNDDILSRVIHFGLDISGGNGSGINVTTSCLPYGGQGGAGLYIIARVAILNGRIILNGGNGTCSNPNVYPCSGGNYSCSGAGGGGSCILRSPLFQNNNFQFISNGGQTSNSSVKGGNGAMLVIED